MRLKRSMIRSVSRRPDRTLERKADRIWQMAVIRAAGGRCEICGRPATVAHHITGRDNKPLRHMMGNGLALCRKHHDWVHANPRETIAFLGAKFPARLAIWRLRHRTEVLGNYGDHLEERIKELTGWLASGQR